MKGYISAGDLAAARQILDSDIFAKMELAQAQAHVLASGFDPKTDAAACVLATAMRTETQMRTAEMELHAARLAAVVGRMDRLEQKLSATSKQLAALGRTSKA